MMANKNKVVASKHHCQWKVPAAPRPGEAWKYPDEPNGPTGDFKDMREAQHEGWGEVSVEDSQGKPALALEMTQEAK